MERKSFVFYKDWRDAIMDLPNEIRLEVYDSIIEYALSGKQRTLKSLASVAFNFIKLQIDRDTERYVSIVDRNHKNGQLGGRPKKPKETQKTQVVFEKPKKPDDDNDDDNDFKEKESNKEKENQSRFAKFQQWIKENAPNVAKMKEPFTEKQFDAIVEEYQMQDITSLLLEMHNYKDLTKKNVSANLTFKKWMKIRNR
ncbi:MAG: DUF6291 domain-containing protein [Prevotellaceae bacterium]|nr:DUF6291 domain-containing protein [Prevotellaceae bacterium]